MSGDYNIPFSLEGKIEEGDIFPVFYHIYKNDLSGILIVRYGDCEKRIFIRDRKIIFATSTRREDSFGDFLLRKQLIDRPTYNTAIQYMLKSKKRFGRALLELGLFSYDQIWTWIPNHLKAMVHSLFHIKNGSYRMSVKEEADIGIENIVLDMDMLSVLVEAAREYEAKTYMEKKFEEISNLYIWNAHAPLVNHLELKPYEIHVFDLVRRWSKLEDILSHSELLEFHTYRILYLLLVLEIISTNPNIQTPQPDSFPEMENPDADIYPSHPTGRLSVFNSFDEALKYYNIRYEMIYKVMLKEIGPISISLLTRAIEDIRDNLPTYLQRVQLKPDGTIDEGLMSKALWYYDFNRHVGDFLRGLEEVLYTEIFAVKKHLGVEYEQQVLKWLKGIEN